MEASARALSGQSQFALPPDPVQGKDARVDLARARGAADACGLRRRFSDATAHAALRAPGLLAGQMHDALEQVRVEALGVARYPGCRINLAAHHAAPGDAGIAVRTALLLRERLDLAAAIRTERSAPWRANIEASAGGLLDRLVHAIHDQAQFGRIARELAWKLDLPQFDAETIAAETPDSGLASADQVRVQDALPDESLTEASKRTDDVDQGSAAADIPNAGDASGTAMPSAVRGRRGTGTLQTGYRAYTTEFDEIVDAGRLCDSEELIRLRRDLDRRFLQLQGALPRLANRLQRRVLARQKRWWDFDLEEGLLDAGRLARVVANPAHSLSFKQERASEFRDTVVTLLIDNSGSMRGRPIALAAVAAELLTRALERCGVKVEILGFTTCAWKGGAARESWVQAGKPANPGRLTDLRHIVYKAADVPWRRARRNLGAILRDGLLKENVDGEALLWAHRRLAVRSERRRILMVISDGAPADEATATANPPGYLDNHLRSVVRWIEASAAVELLAVGIGHDVGQYYREAVTISDASDLGATIIDKLIGLFAPPLATTGHEHRRASSRMRDAAPAL
jgi:cobaltochelatase CobT